MSEPTRSRLSRRQVFAGAGTASALAAAAAVTSLPAPEREVQQPEAAPEKGGGYRVTQHVLRYYQTTRV